MGVIFGLFCLISFGFVSALAGFGAALSRRFRIDVVVIALTLLSGALATWKGLEATEQAAAKFAASDRSAVLEQGKSEAMLGIYYALALAAVQSLLLIAAKTLVGPERKSRRAQ